MFAVLRLGGVTLSVRHAARSGVRHLAHAAHVVTGGATMVLMTLAMPGATSGPTLALAGSSGHGHGAMAGMEGMGAHGVTDCRGWRIGRSGRRQGPPPPGHPGPRHVLRAERAAGRPSQWAARWRRCC
ncbi:MAG TPA: hypothetical protein VLG91_15745 [Streptomyces sp.]|nr:hypothetical protein [Streptomyces sp.]